jgi:predicted RNA-binding Zn ribbon-like protein
MDRPARPGDRADDAHPFLFLGGHLTLDFVNTVMVEEGGELADRLSAPEDLARWVRVSRLGREFGEPADIPSGVFAQAIGLRGALKAGFDAIVAEEPVPDATVATMNAVLRSAPGSALRRPSAAGPLEHSLRIDLGRDASPLPWLLADAGADLMVGDEVSRLRRCANHGTCVLMFLDTSRSHTRRWCSMEICGNRSKVAAHSARARQRSQSEEPAAAKES